MSDLANLLTNDTFFKKILRLPEVKNTTGYSRSQIYLKIRQKTFPSPIPLGGRAVGWLENDIQAWLKDCSLKPLHKVVIKKRGRPPKNESE